MTWPPTASSTVCPTHKPTRSAGSAVEIDQRPRTREPHATAHQALRRSALRHGHTQPRGATAARPDRRPGGGRPDSRSGCERMPRRVEAGMDCPSRTAGRATQRGEIDADHRQPAQHDGPGGSRTEPLLGARAGRPRRHRCSDHLIVIQAQERSSRTTSAPPTRAISAVNPRTSTAWRVRTPCQSR